MNHEDKQKYDITSVTCFFLGICRIVYDIPLNQSGFLFGHCSFCLIMTTDNYTII